MANNILFISYSRNQQEKAVQLDTVKLNQFYWWMDYRIVGTVDWWKNICEAIEESYCMIALLSKSYVESVYCKTELEYALKLNKPVLCLMIEPNVPYPSELAEKNVQYVNIHDWDLHQVTLTVLQAMVQVERDYNQRNYHFDISHRPYLRPSVPIPPKTASVEDQEIAFKIHNAQTVPMQRIRIGEAIIKATRALDAEEYAQVIDLLEPIRPYAKEGDQELLHEMMREARLGQEYSKIAALVKSLRFHQRGCQEYLIFHETYPDYPDHEELSKLCQPPVPLQWIDVTAGTVKLITDQAEKHSYVKSEMTFSIPAFTIAKYPVTNAHFAKFIDAGGYNNQRWWTQAGWEALENGWDYEGNDDDGEWLPTGISWKYPYLWKERLSNGLNHPVVGVSWYEAVAYCNWMSYDTGKIINLPTDQQWQRAAQGDDGRIYPWGNNWSQFRCNHNVGGKGDQESNTTPVTTYELQGKSPFGVVDLAGNVWEWCLTDDETGNNDIHTDARLRVLRGGCSTNVDKNQFRCITRFSWKAYTRSEYYGFRIAY